jgi:hypothetical protein
MPLSLSIDNFIDAHRENAALQLCGKLGISQAILEAETASKLNWDETKGESFDPPRLSNTWYVRFFQLLTENIRKEDIAALFDNILFITFNYDRCIEPFPIHCITTLLRDFKSGGRGAC